jgi:hypothetical protein
MKNIVIILMFVAFLQANAQSIVPIQDYRNNPNLNNTYFKDVNNYLSKFVGTWVFNDGTKALKIKFYRIDRVPKFLLTNSFMDEIHSYIEYKVLEGGVWVTKYNTFPPIGTPLDQPMMTIYSIHGSIYFDINLLSMRYHEPTPSCKRWFNAALELKFINNGLSQQLEWKRKLFAPNSFLSEEPCPDGQMIDMSEFIIPAELLLTKQN